MLSLVIALLVVMPAVGQTLLERPGLRAVVYPFSWAMYSR